MSAIELHLTRMRDSVQRAVGKIIRCEHEDRSKESDRDNNVGLDAKA